jgi:hypothetical protein
MDARMKSHEAKIEASNRKFFVRKDYDQKTTEAPLEEEEPASVDMKPEAAQEEDAILIPVRESEEEMTPVTREETMACQEMEARQEEEEPTSVDMKPEAAQQEEVPLEDATVIPVRELEEKSTSITRKEMMACQEMEDRLEEKEPASLDRKPEVAQQREVPIEDAVLKPVKGWKRRHRGKKQIAERCKEPEELTRGFCGSRRKLAASCRKVTHRATVAQCRRDAFMNDLTQDGCQRRLAAAHRGTSYRAEVAQKMQANKKMPRCATVT